MKDVVVVSACRTPIGTFGGSLKDINCAALGSAVMREAVKRAGIDAGLIDDVRIWSVADPVLANPNARISTSYSLAGTVGDRDAGGRIGADLGAADKDSQQVRRRVKRRLHAAPGAAVVGEVGRA